MSGDNIRDEVMKLMQQKDNIEDEIKQLTSILTNNGVGMTGPLVDSEGFPISNIDVYQVRHARHRIICLQNDHKALMKQIENGLHGYYSTTADSSTSQPMDTSHEIEIVSHKTPFAKISTVSPGSPSDYSGLHVGDLLVEFGSVNSTNFRSMQDIAVVVHHSEGQQVNIKLKRGERYVVAQLVPKRWHGKGLLGCTILPIDSY